MSQTGVNPDDLRRAADQIGGIMSASVMAVFTALDGDAPPLGSFPTGMWLQGLVRDRVAAVRQQAEILKVSFADICTGLHVVADELGGTDSENGRLLLTAVENVEGNIVADTSVAPGSGSGSEAPPPPPPPDNGSGSGSDAPPPPPPPDYGVGSGGKPNYGAYPVTQVTVPMA